MDTLIKAEHLRFTYNANQAETIKFALDDVELTVNKGEFVAVLGHNGCGKSTLAKHFNGLLLPSGGSVYVSNMDTKDETHYWDIRKTVGMVFQNPDNQLVATTVEEDVAFAPENLGIPSPEIRIRVDEALKAVGMYDLRQHAPHLLSGGQKQRVAIAGVIAMEPACIVLDEPTAMLDPQGRKEVIETISKLNKEKHLTIILITHYMEEAVQADRVVVMDQGKILMNDCPRNVFSEVKFVKSLGLDVPQVTDLCYQLKKAGLPLRHDVMTVEECADELIKLF